MFSLNLLGVISHTPRHQEFLSKFPQLHRARRQRQRNQAHPGQVHTANQILPDLGIWWSKQKKDGLDQFRMRSNVVIITGPSRTADITMEFVMGMPGPREPHILLLMKFHSPSILMET